jgi:hypothetical protein
MQPKISTKVPTRDTRASKELNLERNATLIFDLLISFKGNIRRQKIRFQKRDWHE